MMRVSALRAGPGRFVIVWAALIGLLALTMAVSLVRIGPWNLILNLGIAVAKALLVAWVFMHLGREKPLIRLAACLGLFWLTLLFGLGLNDWLTRDRAGQPIHGVTYDCLNLPQGGPVPFTPAGVTHPDAADRRCSGG